MNAKRGKASIRTLRILILFSVLLLVLFLAYWLHSRYLNEKEVLHKDLTVKLEAARQEVSDSVIMVRVLMPALSGDTFTVHQNLTPHPGFKLRIETINHDSTIRLPNTEKIGMVRTTSVIRQANINSRMPNDTPDKVMLRSIGNVLKSSGALKDTEHLFHLYDTGLIKRVFLRKLQKNKYAFNVGYARPADSSMFRNTLSFPVSRMHMMVITGYKSYLFYHIMPDMLFALLLISFTSGAFWLTLRSLRQQVRLSLVRNELVSNVSHELKTPVATVKVALEALEDDEVLGNRNTAKDYVNIAALELNRLELLINQTLHTSLLEEGRLHIQRGTVNIGTLVKQVLRTMDVRFRQQGAVLSFSIQANDLITQADSLHLQGVILNVLDNALKYGGVGVEVDVLLTDSASSINISIADNGPGIPQSYLSQVFDKFFRVPTNNLHNIKGYGLGLSYAAQVMKQHNGSIVVKNNPIGGCTFTITLPKVAAHEA